MGTNITPERYFDTNQLSEYHPSVKALGNLVSSVGVVVAPSHLQYFQVMGYVARGLDSAVDDNGCDKDELETILQDLKMGVSPVDLISEEMALLFSDVYRQLPEEKKIQINSVVQLAQLQHLKQDVSNRHELLVHLMSEAKLFSDMFGLPIYADSGKSINTANTLISQITLVGYLLDTAYDLSDDFKLSPYFKPSNSDRILLAAKSLPEVLAIRNIWNPKSLASLLTLARIQLRNK